MLETIVDVAIVGAGPYGLSLAAHLKDRGVSFRIFGTPMQTWRAMPRGMHLKSFGFATKIYAPDDRFDFVTYCRERNLEFHEPCAIADFARYGVWAQQRLVPELEEVDVVRISRRGDEYELALADGRTAMASRVVAAVGTTYFAHLPSELAALPQRLASHTSQHRDYAEFAGKDVCVVGGGQSAFEAARLLLEAGARPLLLVRDAQIAFSSKMSEHRSIWDRLRSPQTGLGPGMKNWVIEHLPLVVHFVPDRWRLPFVRKHLGPLGAWWLRDRIEGKVPIEINCTIVEAMPRGEGVEVKIHQRDVGQRSIVFDHIVAGTGFVVDVDRLAFLDAELRKSIRRIQSAPALDFRFQSSVAGLYFVGLASSASFGPLFRFVVGAGFTSRALSRELAQHKRRRVRELASAHLAESTREAQ